MTSLAALAALSTLPLLSFAVVLAKRIDELNLGHADRLDG